MVCNQNHFTVNVQKKSQEGKTVENTEQFTLKRMIVTESKSSIRYKTSRRKWVPRAEENVVIQNQTTCTIFHHQEGWEFDPLPPPHPAVALSRPKKSICTWHGRKRDRLTVVKGTKLNMFQADTHPWTVRGKVATTYLTLWQLMTEFYK